MRLPFTKKKEEDKIQTIEAEPVAEGTEGTALQESMKEQITTEVVNRLGISLERRDSHEYHEETISPVITVGTDLDTEDELTHEIRTKKDAWGRNIEYLGTKGRIFDNEIPQFVFGSLLAVTPNLKNYCYHDVYDRDEETGLLKKDDKGKLVLKKRERINLAVVMMNNKAGLNLAENGYAREQQKDVIMGGVGHVTPMSPSSLDKAMELAFGRKR